MITTRRRIFGLAALIACALTRASYSSGAEIVGRIVLSGTPAADVVVSIEGIRTPGGDGNTYLLDHRDLALTPRVIAVRTGSKVRVDNTDGMPCHLYSISPAGSFLLRPRPGRPVEITCGRPGTIEVRCAQHGRLVAYIAVKENPYFAISDANGDYRIGGVPEGRYVLQAAHEGQVLDTRTVDVPAGATRVDFVAARPVPRASNNLDSPGTWRPEP